MDNNNIIPAKLPLKFCPFFFASSAFAKFLAADGFSVNIPIILNLLSVSISMLDSRTALFFHTIKDRPYLTGPPVLLIEIIFLL